MQILLRSASAAVLAVVITGCSTTPPNPVKPEDMPKAFTAPMPAGVEQQVSAEWWKSFSSPELTGLVELPMTGNLDIAAAAARVVQAQGQTGIAVSTLFPSVDVTGSASRAQSNSQNFGKTTGNTFGLNGSAQL